MKHRLSCWLPLLLVITSAVWCWRGLKQENLALVRQRAAAQHLPARPSPAIDAAPPAPAVAAPQGDQARLAAVLRDITSTREKLAKIKHAADAVAARLPVAQGDEIITSYGKIDDMGRDAGDLLKEFVAMLDTSKPRGSNTSTSDSDDAAQESYALRLLHLQGRLPEIQAFEGHPNEIATFHSNALQQALGLPAAAAAQTKELVRTAFTDLAARQLTAGDRPKEDDAAWKQQRTEALQNLMRQLRPLLPQNGSTDKEKLTLMFVLNFGAGFDQSVGTESGRATLRWGMNWPTVPW